MKTNGNPTLQQCFDAMINNAPVLLCEQCKNNTFCETQTIEWIDRNGMLSIYDENFGVIYDVQLSEIMIILEL